MSDNKVLTWFKFPTKHTSESQIINYLSTRTNGYNNSTGLGDEFREKGLP